MNQRELKLSSSNLTSPFRYKISSYAHGNPVVKLSKVEQINLFLPSPIGINTHS